MNGLETLILRNRLANAGFAPSVFRYPSTHATMAEATAALAAHLRAQGDPAHVIGHSLGGLVAFETFESQGELPSGRVVLLGSPVRGSRAARAVVNWSLGPQLLGSLAAAELTRERSPAWRHARQLGVIAGSMGAGLGRLVADLPAPNDGTVCVEETWLPGATDHIVHDVTHTGMLLSSAVAESIRTFLDSGSFARR